MTFRRKGLDVLKGLGLSMRPTVQAPVFLATAILLMAGLDMPTRAADQLEDSQSAVTAERSPSCRYAGQSAATDDNKKKPRKSKNRGAFMRK